MIKWHSRSRCPYLGVLVLVIVRSAVILLVQLLALLLLDALLLCLFGRKLFFELLPLIRVGIRSWRSSVLL